MANTPELQIEWTTHHYDGDGTFESTSTHSAGEVDSVALKTCMDRLAFLSGTLQLPLKTELEGEQSHLSYEIFNEATAAPRG